MDFSKMFGIIDKRFAHYKSKGYGLKAAADLAISDALKAQDKEVIEDAAQN